MYVCVHVLRVYITCVCVRVSHSKETEDIGEGDCLVTRSESVNVHTEDRMTLDTSTLPVLYGQDLLDTGTFKDKLQDWGHGVVY